MFLFSVPYSVNENIFLADTRNQLKMKFFIRIDLSRNDT